MNSKYLCARWRFLALCVVALLALPLAAQTDSTATSVEDMSRTLDSLKQTVSALQEQQQQTEQEAQWDRVWKRKRYLNIAYITSQTLTNKDVAGLEWKSKFGVGIAKGKTYYFHRKPILGMIKIGLDWTQFDISYAQYEDPYEASTSSNYSKRRQMKAGIFDEGVDDNTEFDFTQDFGMQQIEGAMAIGPSVTVNPYNYLKVAAYFHYMPTGSVALLDSEASFAFVNNMAFGMSLAYKVISLGFETRWGTGKYNKFDTEEIGNEFGEDIESMPGIGSLFSEKTKMKTQSFRVFLGFRF